MGLLKEALSSMAFGEGEKKIWVDEFSVLEGEEVESFSILCLPCFHKTKNDERYFGCNLFA